MGLELDTAALPTPPPPTPEPEASGDSPAPARRRPKALDPEARERAAARSKVSRAVKKLKAAKTEQELRAKMAEYLGEVAPPAPAAEPAPAGAPVEAQPLAIADPVEGLWRAVQALAEDSRFRITDNQVNALVIGTRPAAEKYLAGTITTPEGMAAVAILTVFGKPLAELAMEKLAEYRNGKAGTGQHNIGPTATAPSPADQSRSA